ncbi:unnamed protein product [Periconia digitata]|uniref:Uncharacterized protein n=1 Tax=Periconia digitata TaxID=1303443 RepID=A0A9W4XDG7_9PLEO|nr:unnamed protein product [Periconia digitata]
MRANFSECGQRFSALTAEGEELRRQWGWNGSLVGIERSPLTQISREGCYAICGAGADYYPWNDVSSTITTWILPIVGILLQAPFESNAFRRTVFAVARWVGSPIASLSYVLWNIKVSAKAALMVDMSVPFDRFPEKRTDFASIRDSMYLLLAMNQYTMKPESGLHKKEAEGLLRIVLFSRDLKLTDTDKSLRQMRRILARELREMRRRGAVPVFISTLWFLFAFALSIQAAFGDVGQNRTAHDLAMGCLLAWFPILIMASIVDRNPIAANAIKKKINTLIDHVRHALLDEQHRNNFLESFKDQPEFHVLKEKVENIAKKAEYMDEFFVEFAGQARIRWHYGAAHPILSDIERCYIAGKGRNWLADEKEARTNLVLGPVNDEGLVWFDIREYWQVASAIIIVGGSCGGAFILSFFTPTVGLGCRSGGYVIFFTISLGLLIVEMIVWLVLSSYQPQLVTRTATYLHNNATFDQWGYDAQHEWSHIKRRASSLLRATQNWCIRLVISIVILYPWNDKAEMAEKVEGSIDILLKRFRAMDARKRWEWFFFRPMEAFNSVWLMYIITAQTIGSYKTCDCVTSGWGGAGGYLDFVVQDIATTKWVYVYWVSGTLVASVVMGLSMIYITVEWCQQSFLSTEIYVDALNGLRRTRTYRRFTYIFRAISRLVMRYTLDIASDLAYRAKIIRKPQDTLLWHKEHTWNPIPKIPSDSHTPIPRSHTRGYPSFELHDFSTPMQRDGSHQSNETPAMAHSLFPPTIPRHRPRDDSDASMVRPHSSTFHRPSHDSEAFLIRRPSTAHPHDSTRYNESAIVDDDMWHGSDGLGSPVDLHDERPTFRPLLAIEGMGGMQSRQGYTRANSDPGSPPTQDGLGIQYINPGAATSPSEESRR